MVSASNSLMEMNCGNGHVRSRRVISFEKEAGIGSADVNGG